MPDFLWPSNLPLHARNGQLSLRVFAVEQQLDPAFRQHGHGVNPGNRPKIGDKINGIAQLPERKAALLEGNPPDGDIRRFFAGIKPHVLKPGNICCPDSIFRHAGLDRCLRHQLFAVLAMLVRPIELEHSAGVGFQLQLD